MRRRFFIGVLIALVVVAAVVVAAPRAVEVAAAAALHRAGFRDAVVAVTRVGFTEAEAGVRLDGDGRQRVEQLRLAYSPAGLFRGRLDRLDLSGVRLDFELGPNGALSQKGRTPADGGSDAVREREDLPVDLIVMNDALLFLDTPFGLVESPLDLQLSRRREGGFALEGKLFPAHALGGGILDILGTLDRDGTVRSEIGLREGHIGHGMTRAEALTGHATLEFHGDRIVTGSAGLRIERLGRSGEPPLTLTARYSGAGKDHRIDASLVASDGKTAARLELDLAGNAAGEDGLTLAAKLDAGNIAELAEPLGLDPVPSGRAKLVMDLAGTVPDRLTGAFSLDVTEAALPGRFSDAMVRARGKLRVENGVMTVAADHPWTVAGRRDGSRSRLYAILKALGDDGALHLDITPGSVLLAATVTLATEQQPDSPMLIARLPRLAMAGRGAGFDVDLSGAELILPHAGFAAEDVSASLSRTAEAGLAASLTVSTLRSTADPPMLVPMHLDAAANAALGGPIDLTATLSDESGRLSAEARGRHDPATHSGSLSIQVKPLTLGPDGAALTSVSPALASRISGLAGTITLDGSVEWGARAAPGRARLKIEDLSVEAGGIAARGVSGVLTARKLLPPVLPPGQTVTIAALDGGLPLSNGVIRFGLDGNRLKVERAEFHSAAGMLFITPTETDLSSAEQRITLEADGLELAQLLALAKVEGLSATGTLNGRLPLILHDGTATLEGGRLTAMTPGRLAYDPAEPPSFLAGEPGSGLALLRTALTDFRYETLALAMDGTLGGDLAVGLTLRGANPGFYDGHPVALNLKLSGALDTILRNGIQLGSIPDTIREKIEDVAPHDQQQ